MTADSTKLSSDRRLRSIYPIIDEGGECRLLYDLERTFIFHVPNDLQDKIFQSNDQTFYERAVSDWLTEEDLLTYDAPPDWAQGATPVIPRVTDVSLDMSGACNLGCTYCFEKEIHSRIGPMSQETALASLDFAFQKASGAARLALHFGSGEPLIRFDLLQLIVAEATERAAKSGQAIAFELTTNATLVNPEIAAFLRDKPFNVRVSCDGPPNTHDAFRPFLGGQSSYASVERGLKTLLDYIPDRLTVNSVLSGGGRLRDLWQWAKDMSIRHYHVIKVGSLATANGGLHQHELISFQEDLETICEDLLADIQAGRTPIEYQPITKAVRRLMIPEPITRFCGVAGSYLGVSSSGEVYPCFRHLGLKQYRLGDVWTGVDDHERQRFMGHEASDVDSRPVCQDCWARYLCGGGCYADSTTYGSNPLKPQVQHCPFWRAEIEQAIRFYGRLTNIDPAYCLRLFGDDPTVILESVGKGSRFLSRRNCQ